MVASALIDVLGGKLGAQANIDKARRKARGERKLNKGNKDDKDKDMDKDKPK